MATFKRILVATDFSDESAMALSLAIALAKGSAVHVVHVWQVPYQGPAQPVLRVPPGVLRMIEYAELEARAALDRFLAQHGGECCVPRLVRGWPPDAITALVEKEKFDLVVLGSHGKSPRAGVVLGSVAQRVAARLDCPVITVPPGAERPTAVLGAKAGGREVAS